MKGNDNHINSPMRRVDIDLLRTHTPPAGEFHCHCCNHYEYDRMEQHDINTIYICEKEDYPGFDLYMGDYLITNGDRFKIKGPRYVLGINDQKEFCIYMQTYNMFTNSLALEEIKRYKNPNTAIRKLLEYNRFGDHTNRSTYVYEALHGYMSKEYGINEAIIHILAVCGYKDDPGLQYLNERYLAYGGKLSDRDVPTLMRKLIRVPRSGCEEIIKKYADIYDVFVLYDFFKADKYKPYKDPYNPDDLKWDDVICAPVRSILEAISG